MLGGKSEAAAVAATECVASCKKRRRCRLVISVLGLLTHPRPRSALRRALGYVVGDHPHELRIRHRLPQVTFEGAVLKGALVVRVPGGLEHVLERVNAVVSI